MDFHGAPVTITSSPDPSLVGLGGFVVKRGFGALVLISEDTVMRQVPKSQTVVDLEAPGGHLEVSLGSMKCRPYQMGSWKRLAPLPLPD
jgi:RNase P/RNase MRP subunit p29